MDRVIAQETRGWQRGELIVQFPDLTSADYEEIRSVRPHGLLRRITSLVTVYHEKLGSIVLEYEVEGYKSTVLDYGGVGDTVEVEHDFHSASETEGGATTSSTSTSSTARSEGV
ncbi:unnamed protein product, partial [Amoebophrya sp. A25]|eukprot:GSA25T00011991001.1